MKPLRKMQARKFENFNYLGGGNKKQNLCDKHRSRVLHRIYFLKVTLKEYMLLKYPDLDKHREVCFL